jgi:hypothetical protein
MGITAFYPPAEKLIVPWNYQHERGVDRVPLFPSKPHSWVLHVAEGNNSLRWFGDLKTNLRFSHLWFGKKGQVEQYGDLRRFSWAQRNGNGWGWSCETEGHDDESLTEAQLNALARWHVWCGARDKIASSPSGSGIGTHSMGGAAWGGHACPGPIRAAQRNEIIRRAIALRAGHHQEDDDMNLDDKVSTSKDKHSFDVQDALRGAYIGVLAIRNDIVEIKNQLSTALKRLQEIENRVQKLEK